MSAKLSVCKNGFFLVLPFKNNRLTDSPSHGINHSDLILSFYYKIFLEKYKASHSPPPEKWKKALFATFLIVFTFVHRTKKINCFLWNISWKNAQIFSLPELKSHFVEKSDFNSQNRKTKKEKKEKFYKFYQILEFHFTS